MLRSSKRKMKNLKRVRQEIRQTSTLVAHRAISDVAALGDGDGDLGLNSWTLGRVGEHDSTEAARVLPDPLHLEAAAAWDRGAHVLGCRHARGELEGLSVGRDLSALICPVNSTGSYGNAQHENEKQESEVPALHWSFHVSQDISCACLRSLRSRRSDL